jgi:hypothetical protein
MYCFCVLVFTLIMIYAIAPKYGRTNPLVYISICSLVGSVSIMAIKGFGIAVKLTLSGNNQFIYVSTYIFGLVVSFCIMIQMNYFNKALDTFSTNVYVYRIATVSSLPLTQHHTQSQSPLLRLLLDSHHRRIPHPLPRHQHRQPNKHNLPPRRLHSHLHRHAPPRALPQAHHHIRTQRPRERHPEPTSLPPGPTLVDGWPAAVSAPGMNFGHARRSSRARSSMRSRTCRMALHMR